jgi:hypothetical protein
VTTSTIDEVLESSDDSNKNLENFKQKFNEIFSPSQIDK